MPRARIAAIEYYLPEQVITNEQLAAQYEGWTVEKIGGKTGINQRHIAAGDECSSDLAVRAAEKLLSAGVCRREDVDYILLCTQSPDYFLPTTACLVQDRLGLPTTAGAMDFNLGCSGFVYGLSLAKGLIETGQCRKVLLITAETYSKFIHPADKSVRTIFGDAAAATLVEACDGDGASDPLIGPFVFGTDGRGGMNLVVPTGCARRPRTEESSVVVEDEQGNKRSADNLYMNGAEIFQFTLKAVPEAVQAMLGRAGIGAEAVDQFVLHQANQYMLEHLRKKTGIPKEKLPIFMATCGNTVSSTIPIVLKEEMDGGRLTAGKRLMLVGFGVGYSWAAAMVRWA
jgi:3-oxoacyl-[acyl-carrier-protein] synthase-3